MLQETTKWVLLAAAFVVVTYVAARGVSMAYFRSRMEHFRRVLKELKGEDDGKGW